MIFDKTEFIIDFKRNFISHAYGKAGFNMSTDFDERAIKYYRSNPLFAAEVDGVCGHTLDLIDKHTTYST